MKKLKIMRKIFFYAVIICVLIGSFGCNKNLSTEKQYELLTSNKLSDIPIEISWINDVYDLKTCVGFADYVFVAKVTGYKRTIFDTPSEIPQTVYSIEVIENIKGNLVLKKDIEILKMGGLDEKFRHIYNISDDSHPQVDKYYIFCTSASESGELRAQGPNSNLEIENIDKLEENTNYLNILDAYENQEFLTEKERFTSKYDNAKN
ncbi:MAG: hypothetical protein WCR54_05575 [Clostridia bacterium]